MKLKYLYAFAILFVLMSCGSAKSSATPAEIAALDELVANKSFYIESNWALPQSTGSLIALQNAGLFAPGDSASRISLIGNANELRINNDDISSKLPYFGEVQLPTGYNGTSSSISFEGGMKNYSVIKNDNNTYTITFESKSKSENFDVTILLFPNLKSEIFLKGSKRFPISYTGVVSAIEDTNE